MNKIAGVMISNTVNTNRVIEKPAFATESGANTKTQRRASTAITKTAILTLSTLFTITCSF